jgi:hypothetical protein
MSALSAQLWRWNELQSLAFGSISGSYVGIGSPIPNPIRSLTINNNTEVDLFFSTDGIEDMIFIPAHSGKIYDIGSNKADCAGVSEISATTRFYVRAVGSSPATGNVYIETTYMATA